MKVKIKGIFLALFILMFATGCYGSMTGTVVDAETGKPIDGVVVLVEWTRTKGFGLEHTESYQVVEVVTNKEGKFKVSGVLNPLVNPPDVTVYKKGYVAWNNKFIFPEYRKRTDFQWGNGYVVKLERFKPEYTHNQHSEFVDGAVRTGNVDKKKLMLKAIEWEEGKAFEERQKAKK